MVNISMSNGTIHSLPPDLKKAISSSHKAVAAWEDITPLARNEWICWTISVKQQKTRDEHVKRAVRELAEGKRRPCCWSGCFHHNPNALKWRKPEKAEKQK